MLVEAVVAKLRKRIQDIRDRKETIGEENTKATLIEPLLAALGWEIEELAEVRREFKRKPQDKPVDYALFLMTSRVFSLKQKPWTRILQTENGRPRSWDMRPSLE